MADGHRRLSQSFLQIMLDRRYLPLSDFRAIIHALDQKYDYDLSFDDDAELLEFVSKYREFAPVEILNFLFRNSQL